MKIVLLVEGRTEKAFLACLREFLSRRLAGDMPKLRPIVYDGRIPKASKLRSVVENLLTGREPADAVVALTDVYTGTADFQDAADAKAKMRHWVGSEPRFHPHAAQYDFEAWLLPFWTTIQQLAKHNKQPPPGEPESVNHQRPPSYHIRQIFELGRCRDSYSKVRDAPRILNGNDLLVAAQACAELRAFLNTLLTLSGGDPLP